MPDQDGDKPTDRREPIPNSPQPEGDRRRPVKVTKGGKGSGETKKL